MPDDSHPKPSFSPYRKWGMGLNVGVIVIVVLSVVLMVNYLSQAYYLRLNLSVGTKHPLSSRTVHFLRSLTNQVTVTMYYDKNEPSYSMIAELLNEYQRENSKITVRAVDFLRDAGTAVALKEKYSFLSSPTAKNLIIFDCDGRVKSVDGSSLTQYMLEQIPGEKEREFRRKPTVFEGEKAFTGTLLAVTNPKPLKAYFLQDDGEHAIDSGDPNLGYLKFASILNQNYIRTEKLSLLGTNRVPMDCNLLVIAGPTMPIPEVVLEKIEQYLNEGGRLLALFNFGSVQKQTGLEPILAKWGVQVGTNVIKDPDHTTQGASATDMIVGSFSKHAMVNPLQTLRLHLIMPRSIGKLQSRSQTADGLKVDEVAMTCPNAVAPDNSALGKRAFPLIVAVEKGAIKDVITERGTTRMVVTGDSIFLANHQIESAANRNFAGYVANWLLDRAQLLEGVEPRPVLEYRLIMTNGQLRSAEWLLLGCMPGATLLVGSVVWLRRRR